MGTWTLVIYIYLNGPMLDHIKGFETKEICEQASVDVKHTIKVPELSTVCVDMGKL